MCVERTFKIQNGSWRIIIRSVDVPLLYMGGTISTYILLHNMYTIGNDKFDM